MDQPALDILRVGLLYTPRLRRHILTKLSRSGRLALCNFGLCLAASRTVAPSGRASPFDFTRDYNELDSSIEHIISCLRRVSERPVSHCLPSSVVWCSAFPLALHIVAVRRTELGEAMGTKLTLSTPTASASSQLDVLLRVMKACRPIHDGVDWVSRSIMYFMECTYFDDSISNASNLSATGSLPCRRFDTDNAPVDLLLNHPAHYIRMVLTIDLSIRENRLPEERDFPASIRSLVYSTGCFMPIIFDQDDKSFGEEDSLVHPKGQEVECGQLPLDKHVDWWVQQDRCLFFALQMGFGN